MRRATTRQISVRNLQRTVRVTVLDLEKFAANALQRCLKLNRNKSTSLAGLREIFVLLVSDRRMARLHRQFLNQRGPTDVLTFEHGEIFISVETARRNARAFGNSLEDELRLYMVHGLLHLHGFNDSDEVSARRMAKTQEKILRQLA